MKIKFFCPRWGSEALDIETFCGKVKQAGYDGIEMSLPLESQSKEAILQAIEHCDLALIAQHWETLTADYGAHQKEYRQRLVNLASARPLLINTQTGKDFFSVEQNAALIRIADEVSDEYGVKIIHETHRGKFSFATHVAADYLKRLPKLRLTLDISHWCNVAESWLDDQAEAVTLALARTDHIHTRVGFPEGPQIPDPRTPEWQEALARHVAWWQRVVDLRQEEGWQEFTITPEFGPFPYMTMLPLTQQPITNQWDVNVFMMEYLRSALRQQK